MTFIVVCRVAAIEKAEAEKVQVVKGAEADAGPLSTSDSTEKDKLCWMDFLQAPLATEMVSGCDLTGRANLQKPSTYKGRA